MNHHEDQAPAADTYGLAPVLSVAEVAALLRVNVKTVYAAIAAGELPGKKLGRRTIVPRAALLDWLRSNEHTPSPNRRRG